MRFTEWILNQTEKRDRIGDLARDMKFDLTKNPKSRLHDCLLYGDIKLYLESMFACDGAFEALDEAWNLYSKEDGYHEKYCTCNDSCGCEICSPDNTTSYK